MEVLKLVLSALIPILTLGSTIIAFIAKNSKNAKQKENLEKVQSVLDKVGDVVKDAETHLNYSGEDKLQLALSKLRGFAFDLGIKIEEENLINEIEKVVDVTNSVNVKKKQQKFTLKEL